MKKYFEFEVIETELTANDPTNQKVLYPHDGTFVVIRPDGTKSVVWVVRGNTEYDYCQQFQETFISGECASLESDNVMTIASHKSEVEEMRLKYQNQLEAKKHELDQEFELKRQALEHEYEMKMKELETEMPKRFEQGEWVSGKTLSEIIKTLVTKQ